MEQRELEKTEKGTLLCDNNTENRDG